MTKILFEGSFYVGMRVRWTIEPRSSRDIHFLQNKDLTPVN